jgi:uncharacterized repeat protein (TIGR01451 family)
LAGRRAAQAVSSCPPTAPCLPDVPCVDPCLEPPRPDELLCDGGDLGLPAVVRRDGSFAGLEPTETVGAYDTLEGDTRVVPSTRVCIYAPRFGAVRRVTGAAAYQRRRAIDIVDTGFALAGIDDEQMPTTTLQRIDPKVDRGTQPPSLLRERQQGGELGNEAALAEIIGKLLPYANLEIIRAGVLDNRESPLVAAGTIAAIEWTHDLGVQVTIEGRRAQVTVLDRELALMYGVDEPACPKLRVVKLASKQSARPGEIVEFTLRYDNVGNQTMENVTIVDNLTARLEYVPDSAKSSRQAGFSAVANEPGSVRLRWDLVEPLKAGEGGILTFRCRVR